MGFLREFKPALLFVGKFLLLYVIGNICYGIYIESSGERADALTRAVTVQTGAVLRTFGYDASVEDNPSRATVFIKAADDPVISIFEGCNGVNVMIIFIAFVFAFGGSWKKMLWFLPAGIFVVHLTNLLRLGLLYYTSLFAPDYFYYFHKYFFTAALYLVVFALWALWIRKFYGNSRSATSVH